MLDSAQQGGKSARVGVAGGGVSSWEPVSGNSVSASTCAGEWRDGMQRGHGVVMGSVLRDSSNSYACRLACHNAGLCHDCAMSPLPPPSSQSLRALTARVKGLQSAPLRFVLVGLACAAIDLAVTTALLSSGLAAWMAASAGFVAGLLANYWGHARWTFGARMDWQVWWRYLGVVVLNYSLMLLCVALASSLAHAPLLGKLASLPLVATVGFVLSRRWVFA